MTDQHFCLFDTAIGACGIEWGPRGINGMQLPMGDEDKTRARIRQRRGDIAETAPTAEVQAAIDRIVDLLAGKPDDLTDIPLDLDGVPEFNRGVYDIARQLDAAELLGDVAIGDGLAGRDGAGDLVDAAVEVGHAVEIERDVGEIVRLAREQFCDAVDRLSHLGGRFGLGGVGMALADAGADLLLAAHGQLRAVDTTRAPGDGTEADPGVEQGKMLVGHGLVPELASLSHAAIVC